MRAVVYIGIFAVLVSVACAWAQDGGEDEHRRASARLHREMTASMESEKVLLFEKELIQTADVVALGEVVNSPASWRKRDSVWHKSERFEVVLAVERCIIGDCGDTIRFWQQRMDPRFMHLMTPETMTYDDPEYVQRDTVMVLLYGDCGAVGQSDYSGRSYNWLISGGSVVCREIDLETFVNGLTAARAAEPVRYRYDASPN